MTISAAVFTMGAAYAFGTLFLLRNHIINGTCQYQNDDAHCENFFHTPTLSFLFAPMTMAQVTAALNRMKISPGRNPAPNFPVLAKVPV